MLSEFPTKHASNSPVTFAAFKRFAVLSRKLTNELMLAERVWCTKSQSSLLNIHFRLSGLQSLHIHFRQDPNTHSQGSHSLQKSLNFRGSP